MHLSVQHELDFFSEILFCLLECRTLLQIIHKFAEALSLQLILQRRRIRSRPLWSLHLLRMVAVVLPKGLSSRWAKDEGIPPIMGAPPAGGFKMGWKLCLSSSWRWFFFLQPNHQILTFRTWNVTSLGGKEREFVQAKRYQIDKFTSMHGLWSPSLEKGWTVPFWSYAWWEAHTGVGLLVSP